MRLYNTRAPPSLRASRRRAPVVDATPRTCRKATRRVRYITLRAVASRDDQNGCAATRVRASWRPWCAHRRVCVFYGTLQKTLEIASFRASMRVQDNIQLQEARHALERMLRERRVAINSLPVEKRASFERLLVWARRVNAAAATTRLTRSLELALERPPPTPRRGAGGRQRARHRPLRHMAYSPWECTRCRNNNPHNTGQCESCRALRAIDHAEGWICANCYAYLFNMRTHCRSCHTPRPRP